jgi:imidazolonepropionase
MWDTLWTEASLATMTTDGEPYGAIEDGALGVEAGRVVFAGARTDLPGAPEDLARIVTSAEGAWITPGLVDCHTHLVYGGERTREFELRLQGATYEEIALAGGGIVSTVQATREAKPKELLERSRARLSELLSEGVTTVEIKSGYGLETATELKMLRVARELGERLPVTVVTTFLGAHALPPEYRDRGNDYIEMVCDEMLPAVAREGLADAVDAFCERIAFSPEQVDRVFRTARELGLPVKLHAEQLSDQGGAQLVARYNGLSADHLEFLSEAGAQALARSGTVAVLLPGAFYFLRETRTPPVDLLRSRGVPMAVSTDNNPGSSPVTSLLLMLNMACVLFGLTTEEALAGVTRHAAQALGLGDERGTLEPGKAADFVLWDIPRPAALAYAIGANPCRQVIRNGQVVLSR